MARIWLDNARYYVGLFPDDFRIPETLALDEWFEKHLAKPQRETEVHLVAVIDGAVGAFAYARLTEPNEDSSRQMLADHPQRRTHVEALGTADSFQRQGLATALVEAVEAWARSKGASSITATTYQESPVSIPFWKKRMGYRPVGLTLKKRLE